MESVTLDVEQWSREQFSSCELGDRRRNERLVKFARQVAASPSASTPDQTRQWADCKAAYRLMDCDDIQFGAILAPHCQRTRSHSSKSGLAPLIHDKTEISFSTQRGPIEGLGLTGNNKRQGFHLHTALKIAQDGEEIFGLAGQLLFYRQAAPKRRDGKRETVLQAKRRPRESEVWRRLIEQVGPAPAGQTFVHVCDREADNYEVYGARAGVWYELDHPRGSAASQGPPRGAGRTGPATIRSDDDDRRPPGREVFWGRLRGGGSRDEEKACSPGPRPASLDLALDAASQSLQRLGQDKRPGLHPHDGRGSPRGQTTPRSEAAEVGALHTRCHLGRPGGASGRPRLLATPSDRRLSQGPEDGLSPARCANTARRLDWNAWPPCCRSWQSV